MEIGILGEPSGLGVTLDFRDTWDASLLPLRFLGYWGCLFCLFSSTSSLLGIIGMHLRASLLPLCILGELQSRFLNSSYRLFFGKKGKAAKESRNADKNTKSHVAVPTGATKLNFGMKLEEWGS